MCPISPNHSSRFHKPPFGPTRSVFPNVVLTLAILPDLHSGRAAAARCGHVGAASRASVRQDAGRDRSHNAHLCSAADCRRGFVPDRRGGRRESSHPPRRSGSARDRPPHGRGLDRRLRHGRGGSRQRDVQRLDPSPGGCGGLGGWRNARRPDRGVRKRRRFPCRRPAGRERRYARRLDSGGGRAGDRAGDRMRRGFVLIEGDCGDYCASRMLAGTLVVLGRAGRSPGLGMRRGTLLLGSMPASILATFNDGGPYEAVFLELLYRYGAQLSRRFWAAVRHHPGYIDGSVISAAWVRASCWSSSKPHRRGLPLPKPSVLITQEWKCAWGISADSKRYRILTAPTCARRPCSRLYLRSAVSTMRRKICSTAFTVDVSC
jgi:hypothetical protein